MNRCLPLLLFLALAAVAHAQLEVRVEMQRRLFLRGEPIEVKVIMRNLAGRDITLQDAGADKWFGFEVLRGDVPIPPSEQDYHNEPHTILAGDTVSRTVDLLKLYPVNELTTYKLRAAIYFADNKKYYSSGQLSIDVSEGRKVATQTVGVPVSRGGGPNELRAMSLVTFQLPKEMTLYARVEDESTGMTLCTYPLGRIIAGAPPMAEFDNNNTMYAFHMVGPNQYALSKVGVNGEWLGQTTWNAPKGRAIVRKRPDGTMVVVGASKEKAPAAGGPRVPLITDRPPVPLPPPQ